MTWKIVYYALAAIVVLFLFTIGILSSVYWIPILAAVVILGFPFLLTWWKERDIAAQQGRRMTADESLRDRISGSNPSDREGRD